MGGCSGSRCGMRRRGLRRGCSSSARRRCIVPGPCRLERDHPWVARAALRPPLETSAVLVTLLARPDVLLVSTAALPARTRLLALVLVLVLVALLACLDVLLVRSAVAAAITGIACVSHDAILKSMYRNAGHQTLAPARSTFAPGTCTRCRSRMKEACILVRRLLHGMPVAWAGEAGRISAIGDLREGCRNRRLLARLPAALPSTNHSRGLPATLQQRAIRLQNGDCARSSSSLSSSFRRRPESSLDMGRWSRQPDDIDTGFRPAPE